VRCDVITLNYPFNSHLLILRCKLQISLFLLFGKINVKTTSLKGSHDRQPMMSFINSVKRLFEKSAGALGAHRARWDPFVGALEAFTHMDHMVQYSV
jgi:hypothetical protein